MGLTHDQRGLACSGVLRRVLAWQAPAVAMTAAPIVVALAVAARLAAAGR